MEIIFTMRHLVTLMLMCKGMPDPTYIFEKIKDLERTNVPEQFLDAANMYHFRLYAERFKLDWNSSRDYNHMPAERRCFDNITGCALAEFIPITRKS